MSAVMKNDLVMRLVERFDALSQRDRRLALGLAVGALVLLVFGLLLPLDHSVKQAQQRLAKKKADLVWMQGAAPELAGALAGSEPSTNGALSVRLQKAPFDTLVQWLARLALQNGIVVESATVESAGAPGLVNAAVLLHSG